MTIQYDVRPNADFKSLLIAMYKIRRRERAKGNWPAASEVGTETPIADSFPVPDHSHSVPTSGAGGASPLRDSFPPLTPASRATSLSLEAGQACGEPRRTGGVA